MAIQYSFARNEKKYFLTSAQQAAVLEDLRAHAAPDEFGSYTICNLYYDTDDWSLIRASLEKPVYKDKLRVRSYGTPAQDAEVFAEIKKKCEGVVYKRRISAPVSAVQRDLRLAALNEGGQIGREIAWFQQVNRTKPRVFLAYDRTALAAADDPLVRITFDKNIRWRTTALDLCAGSAGCPLLPDGRILMELKLPGVCPLWLSRLLAEVGAYPTSFSKYGEFYCTQVLGKTNKEARYSA